MSIGPLRPARALRRLAPLLAGLAAVPPLAAAGGPPAGYPLATVRIELTRQQVDAARLRREIVLSADKLEVREDGHAVTRRPLARERFIALLDRLYGLRFFALPDDYLTRYGVFVDPQGRIATTARRLPDRETTRLCVRIDETAKCSVFADEAPVELVRVAEDIRALSEESPAR